MIVFQKVFATFFEIPGIFFVLAFILFLFLRKRFSKKYWTYYFVIFTMFYLCSSNFFIKPFVLLREGEYRTESFSKDADHSSSLIVVLGGGIKLIGSSNDSEPLVELSDSSLQRLNHGFSIFKKTGTLILLSGGIVPGRPEISESEIMKKTLILWGVPEEMIIIENLSRNTFENAVNSVNLAREKTESILLVTSALHIKRAASTFVKAIEKEGRNLRVIPQPCDFRAEREVTSFYDFLPSVSALESLQFLIHEILGDLFYMIRGY